MARQRLLPPSLSPAFRALAGYLLVTALFLLAGCSESPPTDKISYFAQNSTPDDGSITLTVEDDGPDDVLLRLESIRFDGNLGAQRVAFALRFDPDVALFDELLPGKAFGSEASDTAYDVSVDNGAGEVRVTMTAAQPDLVLEGSRALAYLRFVPADTGNTPVKFFDAEIRAGVDGAAPLVTGVSWYGGFITTF